MSPKNMFHALTQALGLAAHPENGHGAELPAMGRVVPDASRCVQCGVCGYNCPVGVPVRDYAHRGLPVDDPQCLTCGQCIEVCPRGTLRWETTAHALVADHSPSAVSVDAMPGTLESNYRSANGTGGSVDR